VNTPDPVRVHLVCGGRYHDFDYARLQILAGLAAHQEARTTVSGDYRETPHGGLDGIELLVTYTCDVRPTLAEQEALREWVEGGGRWLALHGTNAALDLTPEGVVSPRVIPVLAEILGSQFVAHPPIAPYRVEVTAPEHPLVAGVQAFETSDELYLSEYHGAATVLLHTRFGGEATGFVESSWSEPQDHPVMYLRRVGSGTVLYLTLGHCRGHYDMRPVSPWWPTVDRGSWDLEVFRLLLERATTWGLGKPIDEEAG
jgi:type 1 glutamine amidotransferase